MTMIKEHLATSCEFNVAECVITSLPIEHVACYGTVESANQECCRSLKAEFLSDDVEPAHGEIAIAAYYIWQVKTDWYLADNSDLANWFEGEKLLRERMRDA